MSEPRLVRGHAGKTLERIPLTGPESSPRVVKFSFIVGVTPLHDIVEEVQRRVLIAALETCSGRVGKAAKLLGISRWAMYDKIKRLQVKEGK